MTVELPTPDTTLRAMQAIVGASACRSGEADMQAYVTDYRGIYRGQAQVVVLPSSTEEVSRVLQWCHARRVPVVPQGGNTSLMGGAVPDDSGTAVVVNLSRMNRVLAIDPVNDTMTVQAGVTLSAARSAAEAEQRLFPLRIGSEGSCQIGGNLSTNAGGTAVLRYGNMRDLVLGLEVVLPDGRIYSSLRGLRKDNTGYDLKQLFIGAEGTLGVITGAVLKLMPQPRSSAVAFVAVPDPAAAVALLGEAKRLSGQAVTAFELVSRPALDLVLEYLGNVASPLQDRHDWMVLVELTSGSDAESLNATLMEILESGFSQGLVLDAAVAASLSDAQTFWRIREEISDAQTRTGGSIKCDVSVPLSRIAAFVEEASARVLELVPDARMVMQIVVDGLSDAFERRVDLDLGVGVELQWEEVIGQLPGQEAFREPVGFNALLALQEQAASQAGIFPVSVMGAMALVVRKAAGIQRVRCAIADIVESAFVEVVAGRLARWAGRRDAALLAIARRVARQPRAAVDAMGFQGQPVRPDVALFEYVHTDVILLSNWIYRFVNFSAIPEK